MWLYRLILIKVKWVKIYRLYFPTICLSSIETMTYPYEETLILRFLYQIFFSPKISFRKIQCSTRYFEGKRHKDWTKENKEAPQPLDPTITCARLLLKCEPVLGCGIYNKISLWGLFLSGGGGMSQLKIPIP